MIWPFNVLSISSLRHVRGDRLCSLLDYQFLIFYVIDTWTYNELICHIMACVLAKCQDENLHKIPTIAFACQSPIPQGSQGIRSFAWRWGGWQSQSIVIKYNEMIQHMKYLLTLFGHGDASISWIIQNGRYLSNCAACVWPIVFGI